MTEEKEKPKKPEIIKVDKDFLQTVLKTLKNLEKEVNLMKQGGFKPETPSETSEAKNIPPVAPERDYIFQCSEIQSIDKVPPSFEDLARYKQRSVEFQKKVEILMKEHKVVQFSAFFLKKL